MAQTDVIPTGETLIVQSDLDTPEERDRDDLQAIVAEALNSLGGDDEGAVIQVWRLKENDPRDRTYLTEMNPGEFSLKRVADDFGGGHYEMCIRVPRVVNGRMMGTMIVKRPRFRVSGQPKNPRREEISTERNPVLELAQAMREEMSALRESLNKPQKSLVEQLREAKELVSMFTPPAQPTVNPMTVIKETFEMVGKVKELTGANDAPAGASSSEFMTFMREFGPIFRNVAEKHLNPGAQPQPAALIAGEPDMGPGPSPEPVSAPQPIIEGDSVNLFKKAQETLYKAYAASLYEQARSNADPVPVAGELYENLPDDFLEWLFDEKVDYMATLAQYDARIRQFPDWFKRLREELKKIDDAQPAE